MIEDNNINIDLLKKDRDFKDSLYKQINRYDFVLVPPLPSTNMRYKRGPWNTLNELGIFNVEDILNEFERIILRSSKLSSKCREFIKDIMVLSYIDYKQNKENGSKEENRDKDTLNK